MESQFFDIYCYHFVMKVLVQRRMPEGLLICQKIQMLHYVKELFDDNKLILFVRLH